MNQDHHNTNKRLVMEKQLRSLMLGVGELLQLVCFALLTNNKAVALLNRSSFPPGFIFGSGSGSYQVLIYPLIFVLLLLIHLASIHPSIENILTSSVSVTSIISVWRRCKWRWSRTKHLGFLHPQTSRSVCLCNPIFFFLFSRQIKET